MLDERINRRIRLFLELRSDERHEQLREPEISVASLVDNVLGGVLLMTLVQTQSFDQAPRVDHLLLGALQGCEDVGQVVERSVLP